MQNQQNNQNKRHIKQELNQASAKDLVIAWELNTQKIMNLLDQTLELRLKMRDAVSESDFTDFVFLDALKADFNQFKAIAEEF